MINKKDLRIANHLKRQWGLLDPNNGLQDPTPVMDKIEFKEDPI